MAKYLAVDWDRCEARFVYASARGSELQILAAGGVAIAEAANRSDKETAVEIGTQLRAALDHHHIGRMPALICIERAGLELLPLTLPPAADAELPELVANEVLRESASAADGAAFDFVAFGTDASAARKVLAAVLPPEQRKRIETIAEASQLRPQRLEPRCFAAAMLHRLLPPSEEMRLLVHPGSDEVDFLVLQAGRIVFVRTARLPVNAIDEQRDAWLESEIRRTITVATSEAGENRAIAGVYVFGGQQEYERLCDRVQQGQLLAAQSVNPLEPYELPTGFAPEHPGRFAALLGMLADEAANRAPVMDFLNPHQPARRVGRRKTIAIAAAIAFLFMFLWGGYVWRSVSKVQAANDELTKELKKLDLRVREAAKTRRVAAAIRAWEAGDIVWLDELRTFSERFPPARDAMVLRLQMNSIASGGGAIVLQGLVRDPSLIVRLEYALRDAWHAVQCRRIQTGSRPDEDYTHLFDGSIVVSKQKRQAQTEEPEDR